MEPRTVETSRSTKTDEHHNQSSSSSQDKWEKVFDKFGPPKTFGRQNFQQDFRPQVSGDTNGTSRGLEQHQSNETEGSNFSVVSNEASTTPKPLLSNSSKSELTTPHILYPTDVKVKEKSKAEKTLENNARQEAQKRAMEEKAAAVEAGKVNKALKESCAETCLGSALKGSDLTALIASSVAKTTGSALLSVLLSKQADPHDFKWYKDTEFGNSLKFLLADKKEDQIEALYVIQAHFHKLNFPKVEIKGVSRNLIDVVFQALYKVEIIDDLSFLDWVEDDNDEVPGKLNAVVQTTQFISFLRESDVQSEDEDDEVDAPREIVD